MKFRDYIKENYSMKDVPKEFMGDPLYKAVLTAKNPKEYEKALKTLQSIRGSSAVGALKAAMDNKKQNEQTDVQLLTKNRYNSNFKLTLKVAKPLLAKKLIEPTLTGGYRLTDKGINFTEDN